MSTGFRKLYPFAIVSQATTETQFQFLLVFAQQVINFNRESKTLYLSGTGTHVSVCALSITDAHTIAKTVVALKTAVKVNTDNVMDTQGFDRDAALGSFLRHGSDASQQAQNR